MNKRTAATSVALTLLSLTPVVVAHATTGVDSVKLRACPQEDSNNCVWDAGSRGNHKGNSFIATREGHVIYVSHEVAANLLGTK